MFKIKDVPMVMVVLKLLAYGLYGRTYGQSLDDQNYLDRWVTSMIV